MNSSDLFAGIKLHSNKGDLQKGTEWWLMQFAAMEFTPYDFCRKMVEDVPYDFNCSLENITPLRYAEFEIRGEDPHGLPPYEVSRAFDLNSACLYQGFLEVREDLRNMGYGTTFSRNCYQVARMFKLARLQVTAVEGGAYFWARAGFLPSQEAWNDGDFKTLIGWKLDTLPAITNVVSKRIHALLNSEKPIAIWAIADEPQSVASSKFPGQNVSLGRALLAESAASWRGTLELTSHEFSEQQKNRFNRYILRNAP